MRIHLGAPALACVLAAPVVAQSEPVPVTMAAVAVDSGPVSNLSNERGVVWSDAIALEARPWVRLFFDEATLGAAPDGGAPTVLRLTSLHDGAVQTMTTARLAEWSLTSAYFNGGAVRLEIIADAGAAPSRVRVAQVQTTDGAIATSLCEGDDDRTPSLEPRAARQFPSGCTVFLINDLGRSFLTAGHCTGLLGVIEFNVPLSDDNGQAQHPGPEDQYAVDSSSIQFQNGGAGNDWCYFGCFANTETGLTPREAQGAHYVLAEAPTKVNEQILEITGYGVTDSSVPPAWNRAQKIDRGPFVEHVGTTVRHRVDTTGGNSGSGILDRGAQVIIGIHTHGGCGDGGGSNAGTAIDQAMLRGALANPLGVCAPDPCLADITGPAGAADGVVGPLDLALLLASWGACDDCAADFTGTGIVGFDDLGHLLTRWGSCR